MKRRDILNKGMIRRAAMMLLLMLLTTASAWAFKTETPTLYTISGSSNGFRIFGNGSQTDSWIATNATWAANDSHKLANGITIKPNANLRYQNGNLLTLNSITFTFTAPSSGNIAIASVVFKDISNHDISATHSDPGTTYTVTLASGSVFNGFTLTYGTISGSCGDKAKWTLSKQNGQYTALAISGSGAMKDYYYTTVDNDKTWRTDAPWGWQDLKSVTIGNDITSIGEYAFIGCQQLATVTIGTGVTALGAFAFNHCDALTEVTLPDFVASIGKECFRNSGSLQRLNIQRTDGLVTLGSRCFNGCNNLQYIVAPTLALALQYKDATNWSGSKEKMCAGFGGYVFYATNEGGTAAYQIANETDLRNLASAVKSGMGDAIGKTFCQTHDITLSNTNFSPIGNDSYAFRGTYDGGGHTISGLQISHLNGIYDYGLFGYVGNSTVKNVRLVSPSVSVGKVGNSTHYGALIGRAYLSTVENCAVLYPNVEGSGGTKGAIIGSNSSNDSPLQNLYFYEGNCSNAIGYREYGTITNVGRARKVTLGSGISSVSPDATQMANGFVYKNNSYFREGLALTLTSSISTTTGYQINYKANNKVIGNPYTVNSTDGDVTLTAEQMNNTYTVHFDGNGSTSGWMSNQDFTYGVAQNLSANAFRRTFTVTYKNNGGTGGTNSATATATFNGWAKSAGGTVAYANHESVINLNTTNNATVELYANWTDGSVTLPTPSKLGNTFGGWYSDEGLTAKVGDAGDSYQPSVDITLYAMWTAHSVPYIDANGDEQTCNSYTVLTNETDVSDLSPGWYVVKENVSYNSRIHCESGDIHLILSDGAKMTVTIQSNGDAEAIHIHDGSLNIYTQSTGSSMGQLEATCNNTFGLYAYGNITICGGRITATGKNSSGISAQNNITIHSGQVNATGGGFGIAAKNVTLGLRNATDYITANAYYSAAFYIADGQMLTDGTNIYSGRLYWDGEDTIAGKTLRRVFNLVTLADNANNSSTISNNNNKTATVVLSGRTLYRDGAWNTLCLPFAVSDFTGTPLEGATVKELLTTSNLDNGTLTLNFSSSNVTAIEAGKPYIVKWTTTGSDITNPVFHGVTIDGTNRDVDFAGGTFKGNYSPLEITDANREDIVLLAAGNKLGYAKTDRTLSACHAYFEIPGSAQARRFVLNLGDGETTGMRPLSGSPEGDGFDGVWHDLQGRRIGNGQKPSAKGMYIVNGKVAVIK